ncbi:MAG: amidohydrolase [Bacteroidetes bacterium]|nr:MAG: amidohydrolase [Bacteroidota bacterium]
MRIVIYILGLCSLILVGCTTKEEKTLHVSDDALLLFNATIINVEDGSVSKQKAILIDSSIIKAIGSYSEYRTYAKSENQIDVANKFVIPGLWDMHIHIEGKDIVEDNKALLALYLAYGITTVRDCASDLGEQVLKWRDDINSGSIDGPQIFTAGRKLEGINSIWKDDIEISNTKELDSALNLLDNYRVDFVKITENTLEELLFLESVKAASKRGYLVSGHVPIGLTIESLANSGFSSIEHASYLLRLGSDEKQVVADLTSGVITKAEANQHYSDNFNQELAIENYKEIAKTHISVTPTLIGGKQLAYLDENNHENDDYLKYLTKRFTDNYQWRIDRMANDTPIDKEDRKKKYQLIAAQLPYIQAAGIRILAGSDSAALNTFVYPALALHEELQLFQDAGLTPLQILQSATINGAEFLGVKEKMSTIDEGKKANLVILNSNPLQDIKATLDIDAVINKGHFYNRTDLDAILEQVELTKKALDNHRTNF